MTFSDAASSYFDENGMPLLHDFGDGRHHPLLNCEQQTEVFIATVTLLYQQARDSYLASCRQHGVDYEIIDGDVGPHAAFDADDPRQALAFDYGYYWAARETLLTFGAQLGIEGFEDYAVIAYVEPVPDDPSSLYE